MSKPLALDKKGRLKITEDDVQSACIGLLKTMRYRVFVTHERKAYESSGDDGQPDLVAVRRDRTILIECKRPGKTLSKVQRLYRDLALADGLNYIAIHSVDELRAQLGR